MLTQASAYISENPAALELRRMQMIAEVGAEHNTTTIVMLPSNFITLSKEMAEEAEKENAGQALSGIIIREKSLSDVAYEWDDERKRITAVLFFKKGLRRRMERKVILSKKEGRLLWYVPFQLEEFRSADEVMKMAGLEMDAGKTMKIIGKLRRWES